jgi:NAD(P)-dependent dehydrogenase (short-subunit alcohol dehydrogenase family)
MASATTHAEFGVHTTALTVAAAFPSIIAGKTILITGVNLKGLGYATAEAFASQKAELLILAGRTPAKLQECADALTKEYPSVKTRVLELDLNSQKGARAAAATLNGWTDVPAIDILVNNAGIMNVPTLQLNEDGIERHFATNYVGHFLFTNLIIGKLIAAAQKPDAVKGATRVINVSSMGANYSPIRYSDINWEKVNGTIPSVEQPDYLGFSRLWNLDEDAIKNDKYISMGAYGQSKTASVLFSLGLNERLYEKYGILSLSLHPGSIVTELGRDVPSEEYKQRLEKFRQLKMVFKELGAGASTTLVAAVDPALTLPTKRPLASEKDLAKTSKEVKGEDGEWEGRGVFLSDCQILEGTKVWYTSWIQGEKLWAKSEEIVGEKFAL